MSDWLPPPPSRHWWPLVRYALVMCLLVVWVLAIFHDGKARMREEPPSVPIPCVVRVNHPCSVSTTRGDVMVGMDRDAQVYVYDDHPRHFPVRNSP